MIKQFEGANDSYTERKKVDPIPVGCYVANIVGVDNMSNQWGDSLVLSVDVTEGEFAGYYKKRLAADKESFGDATFKGRYRLKIPVGDGTEADTWNVNKFNRMLGAVTASNAAFKWNWNEQALIGKSIGIVIREFEWAMNGDHGFSTEIGGVCSVADARKNVLRLKPRLLKEKAKPAETFVSTNEEVPF